MQATMRKATAGLTKRGSRKKQPPANGGPVEPNEERPYVVPLVEQAAPEMIQHHQVVNRRKPSAEEAALTTKNYRLAKELSELRVRHREECKSVTRLTMENMNLASRCREAISHVAMLKKELAMYQKRAAEAIAAQREQTQRVALNLSNEMSRLSQSGSEDEVERRGSKNFDHILSGMSSPPPSSQKLSEDDNVARPAPVDPPAMGDRRRSPKADASPREGTSDVDEDSTVADTVTDTLPSVPSTSPTAGDVSGQIEKGQNQKGGDGKRPPVFSTPNRQKNPDRWTPTIDTNLEGSGLFPQSASPKVPTSKPQNYNEEFPSDIMPQMGRGGRQSTSPQFSSLDDEPAGAMPEGRSPPSDFVSPHNSIQRRSVIGMNSIDAFEASFDTTFPESFASPRDGDKKDRSAGSPRSVEIYNPFLTSPSRLSESHESKPKRSPLAETKPLTSSASNRPPPSGSPEVMRKVTAPSTPEEKKANETISESTYSTPPHESKSIVGPSSREPKRPEKVMSEAARARYEKALQPRNSSSQSAAESDKTSSSRSDKTASGRSEKSASARSDNSISSKSSSIGAGSASDKSHSILKGSPSALLKRIHQRRLNKQMNRQQVVTEQSDRQDREPLRTSPIMRPRTTSPAQLSTIPSSSPTSQPLLETRSRETFDLGEQATGPQIDGSAMTGEHTARGERPFDEDEEAAVAVAGSPDHTRTARESLHKKSARLVAMKQRRSVKQPVSYAEPSLNTKLRQGDTYFPKSDDHPNLVTPEQAPQTNAVLG